MDLSNFCAEFSRFESWRRLAFSKRQLHFSVRQIPLIALLPLRFPDPVQVVLFSRFTLAQAKKNGIERKDLL